MSPSTGIWLLVEVRSSVISPPSTMVPPLSASTEVWISRRLVMMSAASGTTALLIDDTSWLTSSWMTLPWLTRGVTLSCDADVLPLDGGEGIGAVALGGVGAGAERHVLPDEDRRRLVVERGDARRREQVRLGRLAERLDQDAVLVLLREADGQAGGDRDRRRARRGAARMLPSARPLLLNEVEAKPAWGAALPKPSCTPSCSAMSPEISAIAASISTCGRRWSSWATSCAEVGLHLGARPDHHGVDVARGLDGDVLGGIVEAAGVKVSCRSVAAVGTAASSAARVDVRRGAEAVGDPPAPAPAASSAPANRPRCWSRSPGADHAAQHLRPSRRRRRSAGDRPG